MTREEFLAVWARWDDYHAARTIKAAGRRGNAGKDNAKITEALTAADREWAEKLGITATGFRATLAGWLIAGLTREQALDAVEGGLNAIHYERPSL